MVYWVIDKCTQVTEHMIVSDRGQIYFVHGHSMVLDQVESENHNYISVFYS